MVYDFGMTNHNLKYHRSLMDFIEFCEKIRVRSLPLIAKLIEPSVRFHDPFYDEIGEEGMIGLWERRLTRIENFKFKVKDYSWSTKQEGLAYIQWQMSGLLNGDLWQQDGMSELIFSPDKRLLSCTEYWARAENIYEEPSAVTRFLKRWKKSA